MQPLTPQPQVKQVVAVNWADRWQVYQRLQELGIICCCQTDQPLTVEISNSTAAIQVWSVIRRFIAPRQELISTLEDCWQQNLKF